MSSVVIAGDTSGTVTLAAPAVSGTTTLTLPSTNGTVGLVSGNLGTPSALVGTNITGTAASLNAGLGASQTWQNVGASRAFDTIYTNSTGKTIAVYIQAATSGAAYMNEDQIGFNSSMAPAVAYPSIVIFFLVPNGGTYRVGYQGVVFGFAIWRELR